MNMRFFLFGAGYSAKALAALAKAESHAVAGTTRTQDKIEALRADGIEPLLFDGTTLSPELAAELRQTTHLVVSIAPGAADPVLAVARDMIATAMPNLRWIGYFSTVGVYGNQDGGWVADDTPCQPVSPHSRHRLRAEQAWQALGAGIGVAVAILRLSGIYGPGRNALVNLENGTARRIIKPGQIFNRIHVADIAGATMLLARQDRGGVFNVSDDEPAPAEAVVSYAAGLMGIEPPPEIAFDDADLSPMGRSFYSENKRVSNAGLKSEGYKFVFPDYHAALDAMWADGSYRGGKARML